MRNTVQRQIVLKIVRKMHNHPTVEDVYQEVRKEHPNISKSTIYRNLHQLAEDDEIYPVLIPDSPERFDDRLQPHYHFYCKICAKTFDVDVEYLAKMNMAIQSRYGFQVDGHDMIFNGSCSDCKNERKENLI